jgi:hypothetical protein
MVMYDTIACSLLGTHQHFGAPVLQCIQHFTSFVSLPNGTAAHYRKPQV